MWVSVREGGCIYASNMYIARSAITSMRSYFIPNKEIHEIDGMGGMSFAPSSRVNNKNRSAHLRILRQYVAVSVYNMCIGTSSSRLVQQCGIVTRRQRRRQFSILKICIQRCDIVSKNTGARKLIRHMENDAQSNISPPPLSTFNPKSAEATRP